MKVRRHGAWRVRKMPKAERCGAAENGMHRTQTSLGETFTTLSTEINENVEDFIMAHRSHQPALQRLDTTAQQIKDDNTEAMSLSKGGIRRGSCCF